MTSKDHPKSHILLVDDDSSLLRLMTIRLQSEGYTVTTAEDGQEALKKNPNR
jgi:two-component system response regulator GlrR